MYDIRVHPDFKPTAYTDGMTAVTSQPRACSIARAGAPRAPPPPRLRTLVASGILERRQYSEHPARYEYRLTEAGRDLYPVIVTLMRWGAKHLAGEDGPPMVLEHHCGHRLEARLVCESCGEAVDPRDTTPVTANA